jgi:hypothetical protein
MMMALSLRNLLFSLTAGISFAIAGCADADPTAGFEDQERLEDEIREKKSDAALKAEIEAAADGVYHGVYSASEYPFTYVSAPLVTGERRRIDEALVRAKLASFVGDEPNVDGPLDELYGQVMSLREWNETFAWCEDDDCKGARRLNDLLEKNLWGEKVFLFGRSGAPGAVDGIAVTIFIVGRTPEGNLAGVRTVAVWT